MKRWSLNKVLDSPSTKGAGPWSPALLARLDRRAARISAPDGACIFSPGMGAENFLIVVSGAVRLEQTAPSGRSIVLYRVRPVGSCVMTTTCLLSDAPYSAYGYAEGPVEALSLGQNAFRSLLAEDPEFMNAVFATFSERLIELTQVIDELLLHRVDQKLAQWLCKNADDTRISATHQSIAQELGTAREVVSRTLKDFERRGWVTLARGTVQIADQAALDRHGRSP